MRILTPNDPQAPKGMIDLSLGQNPERFEVFLDLNQDTLDDLSDHMRDLLWRKTVEDRPDLRERVLVALTSRGTTRSAGVLLGAAKQETSWQHEDTIPLVLARAAAIDDETLDEVIHSLAPQAIFRLLDEDSAAVRSVMRALLEIQPLDKWTQGRAGSAQAGMNLIQLAIEQLHIMATSDVAEEQLRMGGERVLALLREAGVDLEQGVILEDAGAPLACASALHMACVLEDNDPTAGALGIELLINQGADIDRVLGHRNAPQGAGLRAVMRHPKMRARALAQVAGQGGSRHQGPGRL